MKKILTIAILASVIVIVCFNLFHKHSSDSLIFPTANIQIPADSVATTTPDPLFNLNKNLSSYLTSKDSRLTPLSEYLLTKPHWPLIVAISAAESSFCRHELYNNCWGIKASHGQSATVAGYAKFATLRDGIDAAEDLIASKQERGLWLTVHSMNGSYVVPYSQNWENVVTGTLDQLKQKVGGF